MERGFTNGNEKGRRVLVKVMGLLERDREVSCTNVRTEQTIINATTLSFSMLITGK